LGGKSFGLISATALIEPGAIVVAGDEDAPAVAEVVDIVDKSAGRVVHLHILPGLEAGRTKPRQ
jgi:hypothetical protein